MKSQIEYVLWGTRNGDEAWQEELITTAVVSVEGEAKLERAQQWAREQGFGRFRVTKDRYPCE